MVVPGLLLLLASLAAGGHPDSQSRSELVVEGARARLTLRFQSLSAIEVLEGLDRDGDLALSAEELGAGRERLGDYLVRSWRLLAPDGSPLAPGVVESLALLERALEGPLAMQWLEARVRFEAPAPIEVFTVESRLFLERNPFHRDIAEIVWNGEPPVHVLFLGDRPRFSFEPNAVRRPGVLRLFLELGFRHILEGYDHLAFLLALLVAAPRLRSLLGVVTAFTVAHSVTLAWSALDPGGLLSAIPDRLVELAIALSIAYVATENLLRRAPHNAWIEAFAFGLLHGLGFAGFLGQALAGESLVVTALFGFNLGVEAGQLLVVIALALVFTLFRRRRPHEAGSESESPAPAALVPVWFRQASSAAVAVLALYWFASRAGWIA